MKKLSRIQLYFEDLEWLSALIVILSNVTLIAFCMVILFVWLYGMWKMIFSFFATPPAAAAATATVAQISHLWGQYSPHFLPPSELSRGLSPGCEYTFAQVLSRHGSRYPTALKSLAYRTLIDHIQADVLTFHGAYEFLDNYTYSLGAEELTQLGEEELFASGEAFYYRYQHLAANNLPFIRASGQNRVVRSAEKFAKGYHHANVADRGSAAAPPQPPIGVVINEDVESNNTLNIESCPAFDRTPSSDIGTDAKMTWAKRFVPAIRDRLNQDLQGSHLSVEDTIAMMDLCPFETVAGKGPPQLSPFCDLFSQDEWQSYDYYESLDKYYGHSMGHPLAPTLGVGFVNELIARLTNEPVHDETSTNRTLDSSTATFPLDAKLYADFSHDNDMEAIYAALGLYNATKPLPLTQIQDARHSHGFSAAWTVPFAARLYIEKMKCGADDTSSSEHVRILVNDRVVPLTSCPVDQYGRCDLHEFVQSLDFARAGGHWERCFQDDD